ncbi:hypothetical protein RA210_U280011 [Rubrivivax sp. A210]|nr:hypothetical protein RA210_U280011 [Rubrivivax sp. A210]
MEGSSCLVGLGCRNERPPLRNDWFDNRVSRIRCLPSSDGQIPVRNNRWHSLYVLHAVPFCICALPALREMELASNSAKCGLTPRSSGAPTAGHQARPGGTRYIFTSPGLASYRRRPLSSNVRPRKYTHLCSFHDILQPH